MSLFWMINSMHLKWMDSELKIGSKVYWISIDRE